MQNQKTWQIGLIVVAVLVMSGTIFWQCSDDSKVIVISDSVTVVDVVTGELFRAPLPNGKAVVYPAKNPGSGKENIFPVAKEGDKWVVPARFLGQVKDFLETNKTAGKVDVSHGEVTVANAEPKQADVF